MNKFVLADNPMRADDELYVVHLLDPVAIFKVVPKVGGFDLEVHHFFTTDFIADGEEQVDKLKKKAWHWFKSYLKTEDENESTQNN